MNYIHKYLGSYYNLLNTYPVPIYASVTLCIYYYKKHIKKNKHKSGLNHKSTSDTLILSLVKAAPITITLPIIAPIYAGYKISTVFTTICSEINA